MSVYSYKREINQLSILKKEKRIEEILTELSSYNKRKIGVSKKSKEYKKEKEYKKGKEMLRRLYGKSQEGKEKGKKKGKGPIIKWKGFYSKLPLRMLAKYWWFTRSLKKQIKKEGNNLSSRSPNKKFELNLLKFCLKKGFVKAIKSQPLFKLLDSNIFIYWLLSLIKYNNLSTLSKNNNLISVVRSDEKVEKRKKGKSGGITLLDNFYDLQGLVKSKELLKKGGYYSEKSKIGRKVVLNYAADWRIPKELVDYKINLPARKGGISYLPIDVTVDKVGYKLGEFYPTRTNVKFNQIYKPSKGKRR